MSPSPTPTHNARRRAAEQFRDTWRGRGYEKGDTATFWNQLLTDVVGMEDVVTNVRYEQRTESGGFIDVVISDAKTIVEQKALGVDLDKPEPRQGRLVTPFEQALSYANAMPYSLRPRFIVVCNFDEFRIYDLDQTPPPASPLRQLPPQRATGAVPPPRLPHRPAEGTAATRAARLDGRGRAHRHALQGAARAVHRPR